MIENFEFKEKYDIGDLLRVIELLRKPGGCPWDAAQTHESIRYSFIEETYEAVEAINKQNPAMLREELGDVLMQILLHCQMEQEVGGFDFADVVDEVTHKLIVRHPHVFGTESADTVDSVLDKWDAIKMRTKHQETISETMQSVPMEFPALMRAQKVQKKAAKVGFDFSDTGEALSVLIGEIEELKSALEKGDSVNAGEELGDILFSAVNVSRFLNTNAEECLTVSTNKFISRFEGVEKLAGERGIDIKNASMSTLDKLWDEVKKESI